MVYNIEVDEADVARVQRKLKNLSKASGKIRNAINRTATWTLNSIKEGTAQGYTIKGGKKAKPFKTDIKKQRASPAHLDATIKAAGEPLSLKKYFKTTAPAKGVQVDIVRTGLKPLKSNKGGAAFVATMDSGHTAIFQREKSTRLKIHEKYGNSVPSMVKKVWEGERGGQGDLSEKTRKKLQEEIRKEIANIM